MLTAKVSAATPSRRSSQSDEFGEGTIFSGHDGEKIEEDVMNDDDSQGSQLSDLNEDLAAQESTSTDSKYHVRYSEHMGLEWSVAGTNEWVLAVYHDDIHDALIEESKKLGSYTYRPASGNPNNDVTAFHPDHQDWGTSRNQYPEIIFQYQPEDKDKAKSQPDCWYTEEVELILGYGNRSLREFPGLPVTISSAIKGVHLEALFRLNPAATIIDIRDRMLQDPGNKHRSGTDPINTNTVSMRRTRARKIAGCIAWETRSGTTKAAIDQLLPKACKNANSTKNFRDLRPYEIAEIELCYMEESLSKVRGQGKDATKVLAMYKKKLAEFQKLWEIYDKVHQAIPVSEEPEDSGKDWNGSETSEDIDSEYDNETRIDYEPLSVLLPDIDEENDEDDMDWEPTTNEPPATNSRILPSPETT